ncbi:hypothetical protein COL516b_005844 [Colletotrichum fioriniae]|nr:uncharacterized protein COL516b_005844 [Colletotrichum fioriniae]KAJ0304489.1 hypothetical protein COL516b_005844 [Colletotrichum fioriniae]
MISWAQEHGEIIRVVLGPNTEYVINSDRACAAIFQKNAAVSSERPAWLVGQKYITNYESMDLLDASNPRWKHFRILPAFSELKTVCHFYITKR